MIGRNSEPHQHDKDKKRTRWRWRKWRHGRHLCLGRRVSQTTLADRFELHRSAAQNLIRRFLIQTRLKRADGYHVPGPGPDQTRPESPSITLRPGPPQTELIRCTQSRSRPGWASSGLTVTLCCQKGADLVSGEHKCCRFSSRKPPPGSSFHSPAVSTLSLTHTHTHTKKTDVNI